ncbi:hypothetical protein [Thalassobacillus pellis]|uniref:hypothetical protein n=1 Tax=Thalassobacillus pellis TaxID=748008 RepID=UPI001960E0FD|nr:hypothetical protein [Thalassobacillus pellis]MBM7554843.1 hypothetical protein [Thalassobacillus pellis]
MNVFDISSFVPLAIGFFGLGTGYLIWGGQALFGIPSGDESDNKTLGIWGIWMPGFMQFITGVYIMIGLTWFQVFTNKPAHYMAGLAFTAYGIHWFALGLRRYKGLKDTADGWMAIAFLIISLLGMWVFFGVGNIAVAILFIGLSLIYLTEIPARFGGSTGLGKLVGTWQLLTGLWLMYLTCAVTLNYTISAGWWM